ncbi:MAG TPA: universal stress protein [Desulfuromonadaceae bacterium]
MALREILVHMDSTPQCATRLEVAVDLAKRHGARLTGLYVLTYFPYASRNTAAEAQVEAARDMFHDQTGAAGIAAAWRRIDWQVVGVSIWEVITLHAYYTDLVVVSQPKAGKTGQSDDGIPERIIFGSGRPVLIVPYSGSFSGTGQRIMVAWKAGRESTRALNDAMPLLQAAQEVTLVTVADTRDGISPPCTICDHLALHGVTVHGKSLPASNMQIADALLNHAAEQDFDLMISGAYGYTSKGSLSLTVVARQLLQGMTIPLLMSH